MGPQAAINVSTITAPPPSAPPATNLLDSLIADTVWVDEHLVFVVSTLLFACKFFVLNLVINPAWLGTHDEDKHAGDDVLPVIGVTHRVLDVPVFSLVITIPFFGWLDAALKFAGRGQPTIYRLYSDLDFPTRSFYESDGLLKVEPLEVNAVRAARATPRPTPTTNQTPSRARQGFFAMVRDWVSPNPSPMASPRGRNGDMV